MTEWNVGCEACHGAGGDHISNPTRATIVNPARLDYVAANDTCIRCHSQGRPLTNPIRLFSKIKDADQSGLLQQG